MDVYKDIFLSSFVTSSSVNSLVCLHFTEKAGDGKLTEMPTLDFVVSYNLNLVGSK